MNLIKTALLAGTVTIILPAFGSAQQPAGYGKQVRPFLAHYCLECHNAATSKGGLDLETYKGMLLGGKNGPVLVPGKPDESRLVLLPEKKAKPAMPPSRARQPKSEEVAVLRAWVAAGARDDSVHMLVKLPDIRPRVHLPAPVTALAYGPDGKRLAAGLQDRVESVDTSTGAVVRLATVPAIKGDVTALAYSPDGQVLAIAQSTSGTLGIITLSRTVPTHQDKTFVAHHDAILDIAFSPDGKLLATTGYDRLIKLWEVATGKEVRTLKDHSDAVYGLAFSPDGKLLASCAADRAVKVWDVNSGIRLYTLGESTDWVYGVAWSPDGHRLAAGSVDKSIRVWEVTREGGKIVQSVFAHEGPVLRVVYSRDGKVLYSLGEDRMIKAWDTASMLERKVYAPQPDSTFALAVRPDRQQLAVGRHDGVLAFLDEATGKIQSQPLPAQPRPPVLFRLDPNAGPRGRPFTAVFEGSHLDEVTELAFPESPVKPQVVIRQRRPSMLVAELTFPPETQMGSYKIAVKSAAGQSAALTLTIDPYMTTAEIEPNDSPATGQWVELPVTVVGGLAKAGDVDFYRFNATAGQEIGIKADTSGPKTRFEPILELIDPSGKVVAESEKGLLGHKCEMSGTYHLGIRDREYRGSPDMHYRLHIGNLPVVSEVFPLGIQRGTRAVVHCDGVNLGSATMAEIKVPADAAVGSQLPIKLKTPHGEPLGDPMVVVGEFPERISRGATLPNGAMTVPGTANGMIEQPGQTQTWRFPARKGKPLIVEVNARRIGSALDSYIEILDPFGHNVPRAVLRSVAKTYVTFRDHDAVGSGIRLENWAELAMNDYLWVGSELVRVYTLPRNPDDDCQFYSQNGQRLAFLDTTSTFLSLGSPMYKVTIHPPGSVFPSNGFPLIHLDYRNDDGGPGYGKDSRLHFDPPADGEYLVRIGDVRGLGGRNYAYRLTVRPPRPDFTVSFGPTAPKVWRGGAVPVTVSANRTDDFEGPISIQVENVPPGFSAPATSIPEGENSTAFAFWADGTAKNPGKAPPLKLVARAMIDGQEVIRTATGGVPQVVDPGDLVATTEQSEITLRPGRQVYLTVRIERKNKFAGRVPLEVRGLPYGVRVLDIGLNGILITEKDTSRTMAIYAEPWVKPTTHPIVVLANREGKGTEHAARSVLLHVVADNLSPEGPH